MLTIFLTIFVVVVLMIGARYLGEYHEHKRKLRMQRHHVEWVLTELDRQRKDRDA